MNRHLKPPVPAPEFTLRSITRDDLQRLAGPRDKSVSVPKRLRESHHRVADLLAMGFTTTQTAFLTGYSVTRILQLAQSPAMRELIATKTADAAARTAEMFDAFADYATKNMIAAERQLADKLAEADAEGELLPTRDLLAIVSDRADRFGYGKKSTSVNLNVDFAARLEAAIQRSGKVIDQAPSPATGARIRRIA